MASLINAVLKTELTFIPGFLEKHFGNYYNNALCNGATWMFAFWYILHLLFDNFLNALLKKMRYKDYLCTRIKQSFWYLGFYAAAFFYCTAILLQNNTHFFTLRQPFDISSPSQGSSAIVLGYIVLTTFFLHSAAWEGLKYRNKTLALSQLLLFFLFLFAYFLRFIGGSLKLTTLLAVTHIILEITRSITSLIKMQTDNKSGINYLFWTCLLIYFLNDILILPSMLAYPLFLRLPKAESFILFIVLGWLILEIYDSVLYKSVCHWLYHSNDSEKNSFYCKGNILECSLFQPRNDVTFHLQILKREVKEREEKSLSLQKPKNRNMIMQTLKCMVAIKRKLRRRRQANSSPEIADTEDINSLVSEDAFISENEDSEVNDGNKEEIVGGKLQFNIQNNAIDFSKLNFKSKQE